VLVVFEHRGARDLERAVVGGRERRGEVVTIDAGS